MMHPFNVTGNRPLDLTLLFGVVTVVASTFAWAIYVVYARATREEDDTRPTPPNPRTRDNG